MRWKVMLWDYLESGDGSGGGVCDSFPLSVSCPANDND